MAEKIIPLVEVLPATPDVAALQQMTDPIVVVTKILKTGTNRQESQLIVNGKRFRDADEIIKLQDLIPQPGFDKGGPGTYKFEVVDSNSAARVAWQIRLGQGNVETNEPVTVSSSLPQTVARNIIAAPPAPLAPESQSLGNGWVYNTTLFLLTSPSGRLYNWRQGQPIPDESSLYPVTPTTTSTAAPSTPLGQQLFPNPELETTRRQLEAVQTQLAEAREAQREQQRRDEIMRMQDASTKQMAELQARFEATIAKLTDKPSEDPKLALLERRLEEERRERAERDRLEAMRNETNAKLAALENALRDSSKPDAMVTFLTQFMSQMQQTNQQTLTMMRESAQQQLAVASQNAMTPDQLMRMLREQAELANNSGSSVINEKMVAVLGNVLDMTTRFQRTQSEIAGSNGGGIDWAALISQIADRGGGAIQAVAQARMREAAATEAKARAVAASVRARQPQPQRFPAAQPQPQPTPQPAPQSDPLPPKTDNDKMRDQMAVEMGLVPSVKKPAPAPATIDTVVAESKSAPTTKSSATEVSKQLAQLKKMSTKQLHKLLDKAPDDAFFGAFLPQVESLRGELAESADAYTPEDIAKYVLEARAFIAEASQDAGKLPIVIEMFGAEQYEYLIDRLLPETVAEFRALVVESMQQQLEEENAESGSVED